jgi:hypothetical protein
MDDNSQILMFYDLIETLMKEKNVDADYAKEIIESNLEDALQDYKDDHGES